MKKIFLFLSSTLLVLTAHAATVAIFTDNTFNLANYSESIGTTGGATVSFAQCPNCGNPGQALQILVTFATTADAAGVGFVNNTFAYNPSPIPVTSINFSVDKNLSSNIPFDPSTTIGTAFRPLIEQDGLFYIAAVSGPIYDNLRLLINNGPATVPECGNTAELLLGSVAALLLVSRIRQRHQPS